MAREERPCELCHATTSGKVYVNKYTFRYGRLTDQRVRSQRNYTYTTIYTQRDYAIADTPASAFLCNRCVAKEHKRPFRTAKYAFLGGVALGVAAAIIATLTAKASPPIRDVAIVIAVVVGLTGAVGFFVAPFYALIHISRLGGSYEIHAQALAIKLRKAALVQEGWDTFWNDEEFRNLRAKMPGL